MKTHKIQQGTEDHSNQEKGNGRTMCYDASVALCALGFASERAQSTEKTCEDVRDAAPKSA